MPERPRLIVLTDIGGDPDDEQSLIRLLVHTNEFRIEGILCEHWRDGHRYDPEGQMELVERILAAYGRVQPNLTKHDEAFPEPAALLVGLKRGAAEVPFTLDEDASRGTADLIGAGKDTAASDWIISRVDRPDPRPVNICVWGGTADLAQALWRVRDTRGAEEVARFVAKLRVHAISDQDATGPWIRSSFPELFYVLNHSREGNKMLSCYRGMFLGGDESLTSRIWVNKHVSRGHGPLGALYPRSTWTGPNPHGCLKEGDTPSWFYFFDNGLQVPEHPEYGGWGGRFEPNGHFYQDAMDTVDGNTSGPATVWRWRPAFQREFQARMDWCVLPPERAAHPPVAILNGDGSTRPVELTARRGEAVTLSAEGSQPADGRKLSYHWWQYREAGTYPGTVRLTGADRERTEVHVPRDPAGKDIHIILEVTGSGDPPIVRYRRAILRVG